MLSAARKKQSVSLVLSSSYPGTANLRLQEAQATHFQYNPERPINLAHHGSILMVDVGLLSRVRNRNEKTTRQRLTD
jgi:hypothetical protein